MTNVGLLECKKALEKANIDIEFVVFLNIEEQEIIKRMSGRRMHLKSGRSYHIDFNPPKNFNKDDLTGEDLIQREDDKPEVIKKRLEVYYKETFPLLDFYRKESNNFFEILVSSQRITSEMENTCKALKVISLRFPIGVETTYKPSLYLFFFMSESGIIKI